MIARRLPLYVEIISALRAPFSLESIKKSNLYIETISALRAPISPEFIKINN